MQSVRPNSGRNEGEDPDAEPPVLVHAPLGEDAEAIAVEVEAIGLKTHACRTPADLDAALTVNGPEGALVAIVSQEGAGRRAGDVLDRAFGSEPSWARLPVLFLVSDSRRPPPACQMLDRKENAPPFLVLERPVSPAVLRKVVDALAEGRRRQFQTRDILRQLRREEQHRSFLLSELRHRTRNSLAVLQSLFSLSVRRARGLEEFADGFGERLRSLADAHNRLAEARGHADELAALVRGHVLPYTAFPEQLRTSGPSVRICERIAFDLALVMHELATNAAKHGALSAPGGHVEVTWWVEAETGRLALVWRDRNGPPVEAPARNGLGLSLIERFPGDADAAGLCFERDGVVWSTLIAPHDWEHGDGAE